MPDIVSQYQEQQRQEYETAFFRDLHNGHNLRHWLTEDPRLLQATHDGTTPLQWALKFREFDTLKVLLAYAKQRHILNNSQESPLGTAVLWLDVEMIDFLCQHAPYTVHRTDETGATPLLVLARQPSFHGSVLLFDLTHKLLRAGADVHHPGVLYQAIRQDHVAMVELFLEKGAPIPDDGLVEATLRRSLPMVQLFLRYGADIHAQREGKTALLWAIWLSYTDLIPTLLSLPQTPEEGRTALQLAVQRGLVTTIQQLIQRGARMDGTMDTQNASLDAIYALLRSTSPDEWHLQPK